VIEKETIEKQEVEEIVGGGEVTKSGDDDNIPWC